MILATPHVIFKWAPVSVIICFISSHLPSLRHAKASELDTPTRDVTAVIKLLHLWRGYNSGLSKLWCIFQTEKACVFFQIRLPIGIRCGAKSLHCNQIFFQESNNFKIRSILTNGQKIVKPVCNPWFMFKSSTLFFFTFKSNLPTDSVLVGELGEGGHTAPAAGMTDQPGGLQTPGRGS